MPDNRLPTNQSQLDIASKLDDVKTAIENINISGPTTFSGLSDVSITSPTDGQVPKYNITTHKWENAKESGGTTVVANPSGTATADLTKLQVGNDIYGIPSGGSGGHTILDDDGTALAQEDDLQFKGVYTADNSTDGVTEVNIYREMTKSQFNLLSADEKKGFIRVTDEPDIYSDGNFQPIIYSTEEREIGVWTDGKPLYEKTIVIPKYSPSSAIQTFEHGVSNLEKGWVFEAKKFRNSETSSGADDFSKNIIGNDVFSLTDQGNKVRQQVWGIDSTNIKVRSATDYTTNVGYDCYVTIRYTKTTDTAGSGSWIPQGVPTHKYSTEEHIVGTWIDGSTLYEKTVHISNVQFDNTGVYDWDLTLMNTDILIADNSCSYYAFSTYVRNFEKLVPEDGHIYCYGVANRPITDGYVTIRYTKTS